MVKEPAVSFFGFQDLFLAAKVEFHVVSVLENFQVIFDSGFIFSKLFVYLCDTQ